MRNKLIYILLCILFLFTFTGCEPIFDFGNSDTVKEYNKDDLDTEVFYIKNGTKFYNFYMPNTSFSTGARNTSPSRQAYFTDDIENLPTLYSNESIVIVSENSSISPIYLERFYDNGYSLGITGITYDIEGYLYFKVSQSTIQGSNAYEYFEDSYADEIRIETINGEKVTPEMITDGGVIKGLVKDTSYTITFYAGTVYQTATIKADVRILESFEMYQTLTSELTRNGYSSINVPDYLKSGYYYLSGVGFFEYNAGQKGAEDTTDYNEAYYQSLYEQNELYAQQYIVKFDERSFDVLIEITYDENSVSDLKDIEAYIKAPNGLEYDFIVETGTLSCSIKDVIAGTWEISILPKDIVIEGVTVTSAEAEGESIKEEYFFVFDSDTQNVLFSVDYDGVGDVKAMLVDDKGNTYNFSLVDEKTNPHLEYMCLYLSQGEYTVYIYHFNDTVITNCDFTIVNEDDQQNVIIISQ